MSNIVQNTTLVYKNFSGAPTKYNREGGRPTFAIVLDPQQADKFREKGFNIKPFRPQDEEELYSLEIKVNWNSRFPPNINVIELVQGQVKGKPKPKNRITSGVLDTFQIKKADVLFNGHEYDPVDHPGKCTAYLSTAYIHVELNELDAIYSEMFMDYDHNEA